MIHICTAFTDLDNMDICQCYTTWDIHHNYQYYTEPRWNKEIQEETNTMVSFQTILFNWSRSTLRSWLRLARASSM